MVYTWIMRGNNGFRMVHTTQSYWFVTLIKQPWRYCASMFPLKSQWPQRLKFRAANMPRFWVKSPLVYLQKNLKFYPPLLRKFDGKGNNYHAVNNVKMKSSRGSLSFRRRPVIYVTSDHLPEHPLIFVGLQKIPLPRQPLLKVSTSVQHCYTNIISLQPCPCICQFQKHQPRVRFQAWPLAVPWEGTTWPFGFGLLPWPPSANASWCTNAHIHTPVLGGAWFHWQKLLPHLQNFCLSSLSKKKMWLRAVIGRSLLPKVSLRMNQQLIDSIDRPWLPPPFVSPAQPAHSTIIDHH